MRKLAAVLLLAGCQTTLDPNYALQLESYRLTITSQQNVEAAKARAEEARYTAMAAIAERGDPASRQLAILALALGGRSDGAARNVNVTIPGIPETQEDRALKWAAIFAGPVTSIATGWFGYRLGQTQSNNQANTTIASYNAIGTLGAAGYASNRDIANGGFGTVQGIANAAFGTFASMPRQAPNISIGGDGVIGSGTFTGPYSGANSGNSGRINSPDTTRNCNGGNTNQGGPGGGAGC